MTRDIATSRTFQGRPRNAPAIRPWIWPLPKLDGRVPLLRSIGDGIVEICHDTNDVAFVPVFAVQDGVITFAGKATRDGVTRYSMCLEHAGGWATLYGDLEHMFSVAVDRFCRRRKQRVRAGDVLGYASRSPVRLAFELWHADDDHFGPIEPAKHMHDWLVLPWHDAPKGREPGERVVHRTVA